jgi:hypothetical protein
MVNFEIIFERKIYEFLDYLTIYQLKYVNKKTLENIKDLGLDTTLDLRNTKLKSKNLINQMRIIRFIKF